MNKRYCDLIKFLLYYFTFLFFFYMSSSKIEIWLAFNFSLFVWILDKVLDSEKIKIKDNVLQIYGFNYSTLFDKKPKLVNLKEIDSLSKPSISLKCFSHIYISLKSGKILILNQINISDKDLNVLLSI